MVFMASCAVSHMHRVPIVSFLNPILKEGKGLVFIELLLSCHAFLNSVIPMINQMHAIWFSCDHYVIPHYSHPFEFHAVLGGCIQKLLDVYHTLSLFKGRVWEENYTVYRAVSVCVQSLREGMVPIVVTITMMDFTYWTNQSKLSKTLSYKSLDPV